MGWWNDENRIEITVRFPGGSRWARRPFWMSDEALIRETCEALGALAPKPEECTVERVYDGRSTLAILQSLPGRE